MTSTVKRCVVTGVALMLFGLAPQTAAAANTYCDGVLPAGTYKNVVVPQGAACVTGAGPILIEGHVFVLEEASFTAHPPSVLVVTGNVHGRLLSMIDINGQTVDGHIRSQRGGLLIQDSLLGGNVDSHEGTRALVLGSTLTHGSIRFSMINGPEAEVWSESNVLERGSIHITKNVISSVSCVTFPPFCVDVELNTLLQGSIHVNDNVIAMGTSMAVSSNTVAGAVHIFRNLDSGSKEVIGNDVEGHLMCKMNSEPFFGGPNVDFDSTGADNQCFE